MKKKPYRGKLIILEGIDGAGTETQGKLLFNYLKRQKKSVKRLYYPDQEGPIGKLIHEYLHRKYEFSVAAQFLLYFTDFVKDKEKIQDWLKEGKIIVADRYFTSTLAYQGLRGFNIKEGLKLAKIFELPKPDLIIYLKVSPETSIKRKYGEKKSLDRNESDKKFLNQLAGFYEKLIKKQVFGRWVMINGEKSIEEVFEEIKKIIK